MKSTKYKNREWTNPDLCDLCGTSDTEFWTYNQDDSLGYLCDECEKLHRENQAVPTNNMENK